MTIDPAQHGLKQYEMKTSTVVFMIFCLCAAGAYGIEEMIPQAGPGLTLVMLIVLPFLWSTPMGLIAAELGSALPQEGGYYKWVQRACGEFWGFQAAWWRTISVYFDNTLYVVLAGSYLGSVLELSSLQEYLFKASVNHHLHVHQHPGHPGRGSGEYDHLRLRPGGLRAGCRDRLRAVADESLRALHSAGSVLAAEHRAWARHRMWVYSGYESMSDGRRGDQGSAGGYRRPHW